MSYRCDGNTTFVFTYRQASHQNVIQKVIRLAGLYTGNIPTKMKTNRWWEAKTLTVMKHYKSIHSLYILFNTSCYTYRVHFWYHTTVTLTMCQGICCSL